MRNYEIRFDEMREIDDDLHMDELDSQLISLLRADSRAPAAQLA